MSTPTAQLGTSGSTLGNILLGAQPAAASVGAAASTGITADYAVTLSYRVYDPLGNLLISNLLHPHESDWEVYSPLASLVGVGTVGNFRIPLYSPPHDQYWTNKSDYDKITENCRIEGYLGPVGVGVPKVTGIVRKRPKSLVDFTIEGVDTVYLAEKAQTGRTDTFNGTTDALFTLGLQQYNLVYGDDFSGSIAFNTYTQISPVGTPVLGIDEGLPAVLFYGASGGSSGARLVTNTQFAASNYTDCFVEAYFHCGGVTFQSTGLQGANTPNSYAVSMGWDTANTHRLDGQVDIYKTSFFGGGSGVQYTATFILKQRSASVTTQFTSVSKAFTFPSGVARFQLRLYGKQVGANYTLRLTLNGYDPGVTMTINNFTPSGGVGVFVGQNAYTTNPSNDAVTQLIFYNKTYLFTPGSIQPGTYAVSQALSNLSLLQLWSDAMTTEGGSTLWRKDPQQQTDVVHFGPTGMNLGPYGTLGADLSNTIFFREGKNLMDDSKVEANVDPLATIVRVNGAPGPDGHVGEVVWHNIAGVKKFGPAYDDLGLNGVSDIDVIRQYAISAVAARATPSVAKTFVVRRDAETADQWREGDFVSVTSEKLGFQNTRVQIIGWTLKEGQNTQKVICDQYPISLAQIPMRRPVSTVDQLSAGVDDVAPATTTAASATTAIGNIDNAAGNIVVIRDSSGYLPTQNNTGFAAIFSTQPPIQAVNVQKVYLNVWVFFYEFTSSTGPGFVTGQMPNHILIGINGFTDISNSIGGPFYTSQGGIFSTPSSGPQQAAWTGLDITSQIRTLSTAYNTIAVWGDPAETGTKIATVLITVDYFMTVRSV